MSEIYSFTPLSDLEKEENEPEFHLYENNEETTPDELIEKLQELKKKYEGKYKNIKLTPGADYWYLTIMGDKRKYKNIKLTPAADCRYLTITGDKK